MIGCIADHMRSKNPSFQCSIGNAHLRRQVSEGYQPLASVVFLWVGLLVECYRLSSGIIAECLNHEKADQQTAQSSEAANHQFAASRSASRWRRIVAASCCQRKPGPSPVAFLGAALHAGREAAHDGAGSGPGHAPGRRQGSCKEGEPQRRSQRGKKSLARCRCALTCP